MTAVFVDLRFELERLLLLLCLFFPRFPQFLLLVPAVLLKLFVERPWHNYVATLDCGYSPTFLHLSIPRRIHVDQIRLESALFHLSPLLVLLGLHHYAFLVFHSCEALQVHAIDWRHAIGVSVLHHVHLIVVLLANLFCFIHLIVLSG